MRQPPSFDEVETFALRALDTMCTGRRLPMGRFGARLEPRAALSEVAMGRLSAHAHRALLAYGGGRARTVLREGRRQDGRLWDAPLNKGFRLRFTRAAHDTWLGTVRALPTASTQRWTKSSARAFGRFVEIKGTDTGDWLFYALAARHLGQKTSHLDEGRVGYTKALALGSPLALLLTLEPAGQNPEALCIRFERLLQPKAVRLLECLDELLLRHWCERLSAAPRPPDPFWRRATEVLDAFVRALEGRERLDLSAPVLRFFAHLARVHFEDAPEKERARLLAAATGSTAADRQEGAQQVAELLSVGVRASERVRALVGLRYGEARYEEGQVVGGLYEATLGPAAERLVTLERVFRGALG